MISPAGLGPDCNLYRVITRRLGYVSVSNKIIWAYFKLFFANLTQPSRPSDGTGSQIFDPGQVSHLWFGSGFGKFPLKIPNFSIYSPPGQKNLFGMGQKVLRSKTGQLLICCGSKVCSGRVSARLHWVSNKMVFKISLGLGKNVFGTLLVCKSSW